MNKYYTALELHKILALLAEHCANEFSRKKALSLQPSNDIDYVKAEILKTQTAFNLSVRYGLPTFYNIGYVVSSLERAESGSVLTPAELIEIRKLLNQLSELERWYSQLEEDLQHCPLSYLFECIFPDKYLQTRLQNAIISEDELADDASPELAAIRRKIANAGLKIRDTLDKMIKSSSTQKYLQESIVTIRDGRYVVPVKTEHKNEINGLVHDTSQSGSTLFIEPVAVVEANNEIRILKGQEQDEIQRILTEFSLACAAIKDKLITGFNAVIELNLYFAKSEFAAAIRGVAPEISQSGEIVLNKARHPLIDAKKVVPINFELGKDFDSLIITGPNTGGKTVILKTVGLLTLMTMCGLLIPASDGCKISIFKDVLVDIGDNQSIEQSLSTFSSHMNRVIEIIGKADSESLVLLDELGSGTDPVEGAALAIAVIERLRCQGAKIVTTTHYQELKMYALDSDGVKNASCEFDVNTLKPTYRLIIGSPGKSNAFEISRQLGISEDIILQAQGLISKENKSFEKIIENLENARIELENNNKAASKLRIENEELKNELVAEKEKLQFEKEAEIEKARKEARLIVERVTRQSQALIDELEEIKKQKNKADFNDLAIKARQSQKSTLNRLYKDANPISDIVNSYKPPRPYKKGDNVIISDTGKSGILITTPDENGCCMVQVGIMKTKIDSAKIRLVEKEKVTLNSKKINKPKSAVSKSVESRMTRKAEMELDIRGYASDEGIIEVDRFIDNAVMSGISLVTIIHGKGTGVLKNAVRQHLKRNPHVKSSRRGMYGEGEDGVTVVELK